MNHVVFPGLELANFRLAEADNLQTPALIIYPEHIDNNILVTLKLANGRANRWRPHFKTSKMEFTARRLVGHGISNFKCATTLELLTLCESGASDVNVAFPMTGANARRVIEIASENPSVRVSAIIEDPAEIQIWKSGNVSLFIDINPGMNRTGLDQDRIAEICSLASAIRSAGISFRGLHYYDGHLGAFAMADRTAPAHVGYTQVLQIVDALEAGRIDVEEVITSGTPAFQCALTFTPFTNARFIHRVSPGTVVYADTMVRASLGDLGYIPAAVVMTSVISHPSKYRITANAGHKAVSADMGAPTCAIIGHGDWLPSAPSEEHLPIDLPDGAVLPDLGASLYLVPRHVCPTVNNFDHAVIAEGGHVRQAEPVSARGHERP